MNYKISINARVINGPWGGGNQFVKMLTEYLNQHNFLVTFSLKQPNIDLILMIHPSKKLRVITYDINDIKNYLLRHPNTLLVHRINSSSERGNLQGETEMILEANQIADFTVFISSYLKNFYVDKGFDTHRPNSVILNGADERIFNPVGRANWKPDEKLKIVTHHWSSNYMKGFDIYERMDLLLGIKPFCDLFEFTFIGNVPKGLYFKHTQIVGPLSGSKLAQALKKNHIYLTASRNEPAGMHHIEGMRCGLPVLYLDSGALPEYCSTYGIKFTLINFEEKLLEMQIRYPELGEKIISCPYTASRTNNQYQLLFESLITQRKNKPLPQPSFKTLSKYYLITKPTTKINKYWELIQKTRRYLNK